MSHFNYFDEATRTIAETGGHGDFKLPNDQFDVDDREKRIVAADASLRDWIWEYLMKTAGNGEPGDLGIFRRDHLPRIQRMVAIAMMAQFEHDQRIEGIVLEELSK
jgi:hypothetical protein